MDIPTNYRTQVSMRLGRSLIIAYLTHGQLLQIVGEGKYPVSTATVRLLTCLTYALTRTPRLVSTPDTSLQIQTLLHLTHADRGHHTRVTTCTVSGTGSTPLPGLGFFSHGLRLSCRMVGLALMQVTYLCVRLPLLSGMRSDPLAPAQGVPYPNPAFI